MDNIKISVVMTTYNGSRYLYHQLKTILLQSLQPDEVIICDDCSSDNTFQIVKQFISDHKLGNVWKLFRNEVNIGWRRNFYEASKLATGDIIFFADQDDIWHFNKVERMVSVFRVNNMDCLYITKNIIDEVGNLNPRRMEKIEFSGNLLKKDLNASFYALKTLGCCECISRRVLDKYVELDMPGCGHDSQCGRIAALYGGLWYLDEPLIDYRVHSSNSSGISEEASYGHASTDRRKADLEDVKLWLEKVLNDSALSRDHSDLIRNSLAAVDARLRYFNGELNWISLLKYRNAYPNASALIGDFAYKHGLNRSMGNALWTIKRIINR